MKALFGIVLASALTLPVAGATAGAPNELYTLQETISGILGFEGALPVSDFISTPTTVPIGEFSHVSRNPNGITSVKFSPDLSEGRCADFGLSTCDLIQLINGFDYGFPAGTFTKFGQNTATDGDVSMKLTVLQVPAPSVPEPSTWAMMLLGFAGLSFAGYRASCGQSSGSGHRSRKPSANVMAYPKPQLLSTQDAVLEGPAAVFARTSQGRFECGTQPRSAPRLFLAWPASSPTLERKPMFSTSASDLTP
jgi:hypothetical protein